MHILGGNNMSLTYAKYQSTLIVLLLAFNHSITQANTSEFPGRQIYPSVPVIKLDELFYSLKKVTIVDVRSSYEYDTLRIKGAVNIPLSSPLFISKMRKLRAKTESAIVVYCNGKTCMKSYKAAVKCATNHIRQVVSFDAGVMDWARRHPKHAVLLGKSPIDPKRLISKREFRAHLLSPGDYSEYMANTTAIVLDVRDRFQREALSIYVGRERRAYLDDRDSLDKYIDKAKQENRTLLIHDAAGKQVRWLQYYLRQKRVRKYYFMEGGIAAYYDEMKQHFNR